MRKLIVQQWVTVDNIAAEEDGGLSFVSGEPFDDEITDDPFKNSMMGFIHTRRHTDDNQDVLVPRSARTHCDESSEETVAFSGE